MAQFHRVNMQHTEVEKVSVPYVGRVLVVDADEIAQKTLSTYLRVNGYYVDEAKDNQQAWTMLSSDVNYDLIITDNGIVNSIVNANGTTLAQHIKNDEKLCDTPIIMVAGAGDHDDVRNGVRSGIFYYLTKPLDEKTLGMYASAAIQEAERKKAHEKTLEIRRLALGAMSEAEFHFCTLEEARNISCLLGSAFPRPELATPGLYELLVNAIEHGNLNIGFDEKKRLLEAGEWEVEIEKRTNLPEHRHKKVHVKFVQDAQRLILSITDMGNGFDWRPYMEIEPSRATHGNGRGIAKANLLGFDRVTYVGKGNEVRVESVKKDMQ